MSAVFFKVKLIYSIFSSDNRRMQIISYVGGASQKRSRIKTKNFWLKLKTKSPRFSSFPNSSLNGRKFGSEKKSLFAVIPSVLPGILPKVNFWSLVRPERLKRFFLALLVCLTVPLCTVKLREYFGSFTGPVKMVSDLETEIENLNSAMAQFAMEQTDVSFDENGNVLSDDGKILTPSSVGVTKSISFQTYKVKSGETISSIALKYGLTNISTLISVNGIDNVRTLMAGQKIRIPNQDGIVHTVVKGDSLNSLSLKYHVSVEELLDANELTDEVLAVGKELFIPGARMESSALKKAMGELFISPISARYTLSSYFGRRADPFTGVASNHTGIDMACPTGTPVNATMSGKVVYVGWSNIFGNYVIINHGNGYQTLYGHMSKTLCRSGQNVSQGTRIGLVGSTGYSTGPHLHFTVYKNGKLVDPLSLFKR